MAVHEGPGHRSTPGSTPASGFDDAYASTSREAASPRETRREHLSRHARRGRLYTYTIAAVVVVICIIALAASNTGQVRLHWIVGSGTASLIWIVVFATVLGWLLGLVTSSVLRWRTRAPRNAGH